MNRSKTGTAQSGSTIYHPPTWWLWIEFVLLYVGVPVLIWVIRRSMGGLVIPVLVVTGAGLFAMLWFAPDFDRRRLWNSDRFRERVRRPVQRFVIGAAVLASIVVLAAPDLLFSFIRESPKTWAIVVVVYPCLSVYPQEIIFRAYPFYRYRRIFPTDASMVLVTATGFAMAHLVFAHWISLSLSFVGGILFARTYLRTRSTLQSSVEHALWGLFIFTIGLGAYFYGGAI